MSTFAVIALLLLLAAVLIVLLPSLGSRDAALGTSRRALNVEFYQQRLAELNSDLAQEQIDAAEFQLLSTELARNLLRDFDRLDQQEERFNVVGKGILLVIAVALPLMSGVAYYKLGAIDDWEITEALIDFSQQQNAAHKNPSEAVSRELIVASDKLMQRLEDRLQERPGNLTYLAILARHYMGTQDYQRALVNYAKLVELLPNDAEARAFYAQALYLARGRKIDAEVAAAMDQVLALDPHNRTVLGMMGIHAFEQGEFQQAIDAWQRLLQGMDPSSPGADMIRRGIAQAQQRLGIEPSSAKAGAGEVATSAAAVSVEVSLGADVNVSPHMAVFIYAKAASGPPMPLAVKRATVADLPMQVTLNDSMAMMPSMKLSSFPRVVVGARISSSGQATPSSGDWQALSEPLDPQAAGAKVSLIIDQQIP